MMLENVSISWNDSLRFIMGKESGGKVGAQNPSSSARGLFQLTAANYNLNPNGAASFGNGVEEARGGIRYIKQRYGTADNAMAHWQELHWY
jgi:SLT domain-containing protein